MQPFLVATETADELLVPPNFGAHLLTCDRSGASSLTATKNRRMTFRNTVSLTFKHLVLGGLSPMPSTLHPRFAVHSGSWLRIKILEPDGLNVTVVA